MEPTVPVPMDRPAPTLTGKAGCQWVFRNGARPNATRRTMDAPAPAPTILASADNGDSEWVCEDEEPVKLTIREALILQSFDPAYPVQGTRTSKFTQIGNAIPPGLARAVLASVSGRKGDEA